MAGIGELLLGPNYKSQKKNNLGQTFATQLQKTNTVFADGRPDNVFAYDPFEVDAVTGAARKAYKPLSSDVGMLTKPMGIGEYGRTEEFKRAGIQASPQREGVPAGNPNQDVIDLINAVGNPNTGLKSVKLPSGAEITGITPADMAKFSTSDVLSSPQGGFRGGTPTADMQQKEVTPQEDERSGFSKFLSNPITGYGLSKAVQAIALYNKDPFTAGLAALGGRISQERAYGQYLEDVRAGNPAKASSFILSPEQRKLANEAIMEERKLALDELNAGAQRTYTEKLASSLLTAEEKKMQEERDIAAEKEMQKIDIKAQQELQDARLAVELELGKDKNRFMNMGEGYALNWDTKEILKVYTPQEGGGISSLGTLDSAAFRDFESAAMAEFLPEIYERNKQKYKERGWETLRDFQDAMKSPATGSPDWKILQTELTANERAEFAQRLLLYTKAHQADIPFTQVYAEITAKKAEEESKSTIKVGEVVNGYKFKGGDPNQESSWEQVK